MVIEVIEAIEAIVIDMTGLIAAQRCCYYRSQGVGIATIIGFAYFDHNSCYFVGGNPYCCYNCYYCNLDYYYCINFNYYVDSLPFQYPITVVVGDACEDVIVSSILFNQKDFQFTIG